MAIQRTNALVNVADRLISVLRDNIGAAITAANSTDDFSQAGYTFTVPAVQAANITLGDYESAPPTAYPSIRIVEVSMVPLSIVGHGQSRGFTNARLRVYCVAQGKGSGAVEVDLASTLERQVMALAGIAASVIEQKTAGGVGIYSASISRIGPGSALRGRHPSLVRAYDIEARIGVLMRQSHNL